MICQPGSRNLLQIEFEKKMYLMSQLSINWINVEFGGNMKQKKSFFLKVMLVAMLLHNATQFSSAKYLIWFAPCWTWLFLFLYHHKPVLSMCTPGFDKYLQTIFLGIWCVGILILNWKKTILVIQFLFVDVNEKVLFSIIYGIDSLKWQPCYSRDHSCGVPGRSNLTDMSVIQVRTPYNYYYTFFFLSWSIKWLNPIATTVILWSKWTWE